MFVSESCGKYLMISMKVLSIALLTNISIGSPGPNMLVQISGTVIITLEYLLISMTLPSRTSSLPLLSVL